MIAFNFKGGNTCWNHTVNITTPCHCTRCYGKCAGKAGLGLLDINDFIINCRSHPIKTLKNKHNIM